MLNRPNGFIDYTQAMQIIENSIESAQNWGELTHDAFDSTKRIASLEELLNIVVELQWRYGDSVVFCFTAKRHIDNSVSIRDVWLNEIPDPWGNRIFVDESDPQTPRVYIKF